MGKNNLCGRNSGAFFYRIRQNRGSLGFIRINTMSCAV